MASPVRETGSPVPSGRGGCHYKKIHILEYCPKCDKVIHISSGNFYIRDECPDHDNIGLPEAKAHTGKVGRPKKNKTFECPVCNGRQKVPASLYSTNTTDASEVQCRSCQGLGYVVVN